MIITTIANRWRGEGKGNLSSLQRILFCAGVAATSALALWIDGTPLWLLASMPAALAGLAYVIIRYTTSRLIFGLALGVDTLLAWALFADLTWVAYMHAALTIPAAWLGWTWGHGAFQRPHKDVLYQLDDEHATKGPGATTDKHAFISRLVFGRYREDWRPETKIKYQTLGMAETGGIRALCMAIPDALISPIHLALSYILGWLAGPLYKWGWDIWVWAINKSYPKPHSAKIGERPIDLAFNVSPPIRKFLYGGDHVGDLLQGFLFAAIRWLSVATLPATFWFL